MSAQKNLLLPAALRAFRLRAGMAQKVLALTIGVDQASLCAVEKGRKAALAEDAMQKLVKALGLSDQERFDVVWKGEHDRLIREVHAGKTPDAAPLVSAALRAYAALSPTARAGLVVLLQDKARSGAEVRDLDSLSGGAAVEPTEAAMT